MNAANASNADETSHAAPRGAASALARAAQLCTRLEAVDPIRARFWRWRRERIDARRGPG